jgi:hypothetical protein
MKLKTLIFFLFAITTIVFAQETETAKSLATENPPPQKDWNLATMLSYEHFSFDKQSIYSPGIGLMFSKGNLNPPLSETQNSLLIAASSKQYILEESENGYADIYYDINIMADKRIGRHSIFGILASQTDKPIYGGLRSIVVGAGYGYEIIRKENLSLLLGADIALMDFGIDLPNGDPFPVMILPRIQFAMQKSWLDFAFTFIKEPVVDITLFPHSRFRFITKFSIPFALRDAQDFRFDTLFMYRLFSPDSKMGDLAGIGIGFKHSGFGTTLAEKDKYYDIFGYSVYGKIDVSFLQISGGYLFSGKESYNVDERRRNVGDGFYLNAMLAWQF